MPEGGWIGKRYDADAILQYLNARYCDPELSLFLQPDWFEVTKAGVGTNRFSYSFNDPVNKFDPGGNYAADPEDDDEREERRKERQEAANQLQYAQTTGGNSRAGTGGNPTQRALNAIETHLVNRIDTIREANGMPRADRVSPLPQRATSESIQALRRELESLESSIAGGGTSRALVPQYGRENGLPLNYGALGGWVELTLRPGMRVDRYGPPSGRYMSPVGVPTAERAMPPGSNTGSYTQYEVIRPIEGVAASIIAPAYGQPGGGVQYRLPNPVEAYIPHYLRPIK